MITKSKFQSLLNEFKFVVVLALSCWYPFINASSIREIYSNSGRQPNELQGSRHEETILDWSPVSDEFKFFCWMFFSVWGSENYTAPRIATFRHYNKEREK